MVAVDAGLFNPGLTEPPEVGAGAPPPPPPDIVGAGAGRVVGTMVVGGLGAAEVAGAGGFPVFTVIFAGATVT